MFALAIYDKLTPGSLTGGKKIAGTGEIDRRRHGRPDRRHPAEDGRRAPTRRATIFLVPAANCAEATDGDDFGMKLVKISTLEDAISSLEALAKDPDAKVPSCS